MSSPSRQNLALRAFRALKDVIGRLGLSTGSFPALAGVQRRRAPRSKGYTRIPKFTFGWPRRQEQRFLPLPTEAEIEDAALIDEAMSIPDPLAGDPPPMYTSRPR